jgi:hypothetical protein
MALATRRKDAKKHRFLYADAMSPFERASTPPA